MSDAQKNPASSPDKTAPLSAAAFAEQIVGEIDWISPTEGLCECPGRNRHTSKDGRRDCIVYLDQIPTLHCLHASCSTEIQEANTRLRAAVLNPFGLAETAPRKLTAEAKARMAERAERERIRQRAAKSCRQVLEQFRWPYAEILADSPVAVQGNEPDHWRFLLQRFNPQDIIWIGDKFDSGKPEHSRHFKSAEQWLQKAVAPAPYICPAVFKNNCVARSNDNVIARRFLVVESDTLSKDQVGSIFRWLRDAAGLDLVAIVDTAGKSLHGWFRFPQDEQNVDHLKLVLPGFGCDPMLFRASQPVRLPGALREGKYQRLVYLAEGGAA